LGWSFTSEGGDDAIEARDVRLLGHSFAYHAFDASKLIVIFDGFEDIIDGTDETVTHWTIDGCNSTHCRIAICFNDNRIIWFFLP